MVGVRVPEPGTALRQFVYHQTLFADSLLGGGDKCTHVVENLV